MVIVSLVLAETRCVLMVNVADVVPAHRYARGHRLPRPVAAAQRVRRNSPGERKTITPSEKRISYTPAPRETISQLPIRTKFILFCQAVRNWR